MKKVPLRRVKPNKSHKMQRQRTKEELLSNIKFYNAVQKDEKDDIKSKSVYWRMEIEWAYVLMEAGWTKPQIAKFIKYVEDNMIAGISEERKKNIQYLLIESKVEWTYKNSCQKETKGNIIDQTMKYMEWYNTEISVNYNLLACEYMIKQKNIISTELTGIIQEVVFVDSYPIDKISELRDEIFKRKSIWFELFSEDFME